MKSKDKKILISDFANTLVSQGNPVKPIVLHNARVSGMALLLYANEPFEDITRAMFNLRQRKMWETDGERILNDLFGEERRRRIAKHVD
ncbi:MAG TPA: hypothetical protein EYP22_04085 [Methanosarcinales archaeon]|nr:hypothetical protein [Methanosarcinales archaeon]